MNSLNRCPECGAELPSDVRPELCPVCLFRLGVEGDPSGDLLDETLASPQQDGAGGRFELPTLDVLAARFPQLEIISLLGHGGMGAVYKARQRKLDRLVALKILPPGLGQDTSFAARFTREARALAKLSHPNIVTVYDFGDADGLFYFVMEFLDGVNLRQLIKSRRLPAEEALGIVPQICAALQYAHEEGIVHRDIKPENVLLDVKGRVKIADFGLAKLLGPSSTAVQLTISQQVMGTLHYMAPEQVERPQEVDHRADIYSLGVVFYELLTGELPLGRFDPPSEKAAVNVELDKVVLRALEREVDRRYQQVSEVTTDIAKLRSQGATAATKEDVQRRTHGQPAEQRTASWTAATLLTSLCLPLLTLVRWPVPPEVKFQLEQRVSWEELMVGLETAADVRNIRSIGHWDSNLSLTLEEVTAVVPNWFVCLAALFISGLAVARAKSGRTWPLIVQPFLALYGILHTAVLMALMTQIGMALQAVLLLLLAGFVFLGAAPLIIGLQRVVRWVLAQAATTQLRIAAVCILLTSGAVFIYLGGMFLIGLYLILFTAYPTGASHELPLIFVPLTGVLAAISGFVTYAAAIMFRFRSLRLATWAGILGQPFGLWGLWLLTRPEVKKAFAASKQ